MGEGEERSIRPASSWMSELYALPTDVILSTKLTCLQCSMKLNDQKQTNRTNIKKANHQHTDVEYDGSSNMSGALQVKRAGLDK